MFTDQNTEMDNPGLEKFSDLESSTLVFDDQDLHFAGMCNDQNTKIDRSISAMNSST